MNEHTLLIVDDQAMNRRILNKLLSGSYTLLEAENGKEAMEILRDASRSISAVVLDIVMPVMDGYAVLEEMRADPELSKIPVIVSSASDGAEAEIRALALGAQDFIAKPYNREIIRHRIQNTINLRETAAIANLAEKDELTGLLSKQFFCERVGRVLQQNPTQEYEILCLDIERFKLVNDVYGTEIGDGLLRYVAGLIEHFEGAVCSSRFDADHFYQLVQKPSGKDFNGFSCFLESMRKFPIEMKLGLNCGVYRITDRAVSVNRMCDRAKLAADAHHGHVDTPITFYDDSMRQKILEEQFVSSAMKDGLEQRQFLVYYQPKYNLHTEMISGAEALVRWQHPERGFLSPGQFIPVFERNGQITLLDRYVWEQACRDIRKWMDEGLTPVPISVNVSRADILNPKLPEIITGLTRKYGVPIACLHLEITESAYTNDPAQIVSAVRGLRELGFVIEMDDFGSGYSSLNMLAEMPVDVLKLDMRFVQMEASHTSGRGIMSFVISLAKWMQLSVVAEGVETAEQVEALRSMDCGYVQGYYYAKPMSESAFVEQLKTVAVSVMETAAPA
ncbi:MAG: EAL domain-containing protein, partial [Eubacteriales bacterium]|nr:EAL domain-containing protein [Eubacteriales bacterium]